MMENPNINEHEAKTNSTSTSKLGPRSLEQFPLPARTPFDTPAPPFPNTCPSVYAPKNEHRDSTTTTVQFDPSVHLQLSEPETIRILVEDNNDVNDTRNSSSSPVKLIQVPSTKPRIPHMEDLAYTAPFRVLSDEGVRVLRNIVEREADLTISTPRHPKFVRGLGYASRWVRDFNECEELLEFLGRFANTSIAQHPMTTNYSQINYGMPPKDENIKDAKPADVWHVDSVDYVLVIMLTDGFSGGELLVSDMDPNEAMERIRANGMPEERTVRNVYPAPGWGIFMQGSRIAHAVSPVTAGSPRVTAVNSYSSRDAFRIDRHSMYNALSYCHTSDVWDPEYVRNVAWRSLGKLNYLVENPDFVDKEKGEEVLDLVINELMTARNVMRGEEKFDIPLQGNVDVEKCAAKASVHGNKK